MDNAKCVRRGSVVATCNVHITLFCDHSWATDEPLRKNIPEPIPTKLEGATIQEMWQVGQG